MPCVFGCLLLHNQPHQTLMAYSNNYDLLVFCIYGVQLGGSSLGSHAIAIRWWPGLKPSEGMMGLDSQVTFSVHMPGTWARWNEIAGGWLSTSWPRSLSIWLAETSSEHRGLGLVRLLM